eukprot:scaffold41350_cov62-Phaeocystis_antarctica.AAC.3
MQRLNHEIVAERERPRAPHTFRQRVRCADGRRRAVRLQEEDWRRPARASHEAIVLSPGLRPRCSARQLGAQRGAAQRFLEAMERSLVGSEGWAKSKSKAKEHTPVDSKFCGQRPRQKPSTCCGRRSAAR